MSGPLLSEKQQLSTSVGQEESDTLDNLTHPAVDREDIQTQSSPETPFNDFLESSREEVVFLSPDDEALESLTEHSEAIGSYLNSTPMFALTQLNTINERYGNSESKQVREKVEEIIVTYREQLFSRVLQEIDKELSASRFHLALRNLKELEKSSDLFDERDIKTKFKIMERVEEEAVRGLLTELDVQDTFTTYNPNTQQEELHRTELPSYERAVHLLMLSRDHIVSDKNRALLDQGIDKIDAQLIGRDDLTRLYANSLPESNTVINGKPTPLDQVTFRAFEDGLIVTHKLDDYLLKVDGVTKTDDGTLIYKTEEGSEYKIEASQKDRIFIRFSNLKDPQEMKVFSFQQLENLVDKDGIQEALQVAVEDRRLEIEGEKELSGFDLSSDEKTAYIRTFPVSYDFVVRQSFADGAFTASALQSRYGETIDVKPISFGQLEMNDAIESAYNEGTRSFFIDISAHGSAIEIEGLGEKYTASDVVELLEQYPDAHFILSTSACFGGGLTTGLEEALSKNPELNNRLLLMTHTKNNLENVTLPLEGLGTIGRSFYHVNLVRSLLEGDTFGQAIIKADLKTKEKTGLDGETIINGKKVGLNETADQNSVAS